MKSPPPLAHLDDIVSSGMCIGCGLCESLAGTDHVRMRMTPEGRLRPQTLQQLSEATLGAIDRTCPGSVASGLPAELHSPDVVVDDVWGPYHDVVRAYAADSDIRFRGSTGGVLTALALHLLESGSVAFIAHVSADPAQPMRSVAHVSESRGDVLAAAGSRYGPAAPLTHISSLLDRGQPFAFVGKPCDVTALRNLATVDGRVDRFCRYMLTLVCGGASELGKSTDVLDSLGIAEEELSVFRYRGYGNPGKTRIETRDGRAEELAYNDMWADENTWRIQYRCKVCPDAIGEAADLAASDLWPGGGPTGEDAGFNGVITRTGAGSRLLAEAAAAGALTVDQQLTPRSLDEAQPHQVRKKRAVASRLDALRDAGRRVPQVTGLRIRTLAETRSERERAEEYAATASRIADGQFWEPSS